MRKKIIIFLFITVLLTSCFFPKTSALDISAASAIVFVADSGEILYEKDAYKRRSMASTTKIMTAIIALESGKLDDVVTVSDKMIRVEGTSMGLHKGNRLTLMNLVSGMMLLSGNDAANAIAVYLSGSEEAFALMMNEKAISLGMRDTNFVTASGLDDDEHYTSAYDMALLTSYAMRNPDFRKLVSLTRGEVEYISPDVTHTYYNHNRFLSMYDGACGVKTGFTKKSGRCLVTAVEKNGNLVIAVTLNAGDDWNDHKKLYDYCFSQGKFSQIPDTFDTLIRVTGSNKTAITASAEHVPEIFTSEFIGVHTKIYTEKFLYAPVKKGEQVGFVRFYVDGVCVRETALIANESADLIEQNKTEKNRIKEFFYEMYKKLSGE
ncbi:MAG: D-alanyl-D-alanine carboxypeptidase [Clostridia bacterium]|nr:D-alanyl-D-alanine carboxypeptidase [Clostridia bacterium]